MGNKKSSPMHLDSMVLPLKKPNPPTVKLSTASVFCVISVPSTTCARPSKRWASYNSEVSLHSIGNSNYTWTVTWCAQREREREREREKERKKERKERLAC